MPRKKAGFRDGSTSSRAPNIITPPDQRRINEIQQLEAESRSLAARLQALSCGGSGKDDKSTQKLLERQRAVTADLRGFIKDARFFSNVDLTRDRFNATLVRIVDVLWPWSVLTLPTVAEGIDETPGVPHTDGEIATTGLFVGTGAFGGTPSNGGGQERWWIHNWNCTAVLPVAPNSGTVSYRFGANIEALVYHVEGAGTLRAFVTVGTTSDVNQPITNWQTVGWPIDTTLPQSGQIVFGGGLPVTGSINVAAGKAAAIGIIFGVVVSVTDGYVMFLPDSTFGAGLVGGSDYTAWGKLEYRFNPNWVFQFVQEALAYQP